LNASLGIYDELAQASDFSLKNVIDSSMGARKNPLSIAITTASDKRDSPFVDMLNYYKSILRGEQENDNMFAHIFEPDVDDEEGDPNTWNKVQPHMGITVYPEFYERKWMLAQSSSEEMKEFRNKLLNVFTKNEAKEWIGRGEIESLFYKMEGLHKARCVVTVDLSVSDDFSAVTYLFHLPNRYYKKKFAPFHSITEYFIPEATLQKHPNRELYKRWVENGHLRVMKGKTIDYNFLSNDILEHPYVIMGLGYDPYKSKEFLKNFVAAGLEEYLYPIKQTYGEFTSYVEAMADTVKRILTDKQLPREKILAVGISISGVTDFANKVVDLSNELSWAKKPLGHALEALLGIPVFAENDARVYARNEIDSGDPNNVVTVLYLNRGVGLALVIGSSVLQGYTNRAGDSQFFGKDIDKIYHVIRTCALFQEIFELPYYYQGTDPAYIAELNRRFMQHLKDNQQWQADMDVFSTEVARMMIAMANVVNPKRILLTGNVFDYYDYIYHQVRNKILQLPVTYTPEVKRNSPQDNPLENGIVRLIMEKFFQLDQFSI